MNLLIRGQSGCGKTHIAKIICNYVGIHTCMMYLGEEAYHLDKSIRVHMLDEAHEIKEPEYLYPDMDSQRFTFIVLTNEFGELKEPFVNRCLPINLSPYSLDDITDLVYQTLVKKGYKLPFEMCQCIATYCRDNPRVAKNISRQLSMLFSRLGGYPFTIGELVEQLEIFLSLKEGGFTELDQRYLDFLKDNSPAGIDTISRYLCIPKQVIQTEIEPFLIRNNLVRITSRGRIKL